jgi:hypothetical protein
MLDRNREERNVTLTTTGKFHKAQVKAMGMKEYGMYRGNGTLTIDDEGIKIEGRHVKSLGVRVLIGILIVIGSAIATVGAVILGIIPVYLLVEYVILTRENLVIPWARVRKYAFDPKRKRVALDFEGPEWTSPAVLRTPDLARVAQALRERAPEKDATAALQIA